MDKCNKQIALTFFEKSDIKNDGTEVCGSERFLDSSSKRGTCNGLHKKKKKKKSKSFDKCVGKHGASGYGAVVTTNSEAYEVVSNRCLYRYYSLIDSTVIMLKKNAEFSAQEEEEIACYVLRKYLGEKLFKKASNLMKHSEINKSIHLKRSEIDAIERVIAELGKDSKGFLKLLREGNVKAVTKYTLNLIHLYAFYGVAAFRGHFRESNSALIFALCKFMSVLVVQDLSEMYSQKLSFCATAFYKFFFFPFFAKLKYMNMMFAFSLACRSLIPPSKFLHPYSNTHWKMRNAKITQVLSSLQPDKARIERLAQTYVKINECIFELFGTNGILFGSAANGFSLNTSDLDITINMSEEQALRFLEEAKQEKERRADSLSRFCGEQDKENVLRRRQGAFAKEKPKAVKNEHDENLLLEASSNASEVAEKKASSDDWLFLSGPKASVAWAGRKLAQLCHHRGWGVLCIEKAKVPILKVYVSAANLNDAPQRLDNQPSVHRNQICAPEDQEDVVEVDVCINHLIVLHNTRLFSAYAHFDHKAIHLALLVKHWAKKRDICDSYRSTLSGYAWLNLVVFFLQRYYIVDEDKLNVSLNELCSLKNSSNKSLDKTSLYLKLQGTYFSFPLVYKVLNDDSILPVLPNLQKCLIFPNKEKKNELLMDNTNVYFYHPLYGQNKMLDSNFFFSFSSSCASSSSCFSSCDSAFPDKKYPLWPEDDFKNAYSYAKNVLNHNLHTCKVNYLSKKEKQYLLIQTKSKFSDVKNSDITIRIKNAIENCVCTTDTSTVGMLCSFFKFYALQFNVFKYLIDINSVPHLPVSKQKYFCETSEDDYVYINNFTEKSEMKKEKENATEKEKEKEKKSKEKVEHDIKAQGEKKNAAPGDLHYTLSTVNNNVITINGKTEKQEQREAEEKEEIKERKNEIKEKQNEIKEKQNEIKEKRDEIKEEIEEIKEKQDEIKEKREEIKEKQDEIKEKLEEIKEKQDEIKEKRDEIKEKQDEIKEKREEIKEKREEIKEKREEIKEEIEEEIEEEEIEEGKKNLNINDEELGKSVDWLRKRTNIAIKDPLEIKRILGNSRHGEDYIFRELIRGMDILTNESVDITKLFEEDCKGDGKRWIKIKQNEHRLKCTDFNYEKVTNSDIEQRKLTLKYFNEISKNK